MIIRVGLRAELTDQPPICQLVEERSGRRRRWELRRSTGAKRSPQGRGGGQWVTSLIPNTKSDVDGLNIMVRTNCTVK
jgi:hypothetical protein